MKLLVLNLSLVFCFSLYAQSVQKYSFQAHGLDKTKRCWDTTDTKSFEIVHISKCEPKNTKIVFDQRIDKKINLNELVRTCKKIDIETNGNEFLQILDVSECRTSDVVFKYSNNKVDKKLRCWALDKKTLGEHYAEIMHITKCRPDNAITVYKIHGKDWYKRCWEVDPETKGSNYANIVHKSNCNITDKTSIQDNAREQQKEGTLNNKPRKHSQSDTQVE